MVAGGKTLEKGKRERVRESYRAAHRGLKITASPGGKTRRKKKKRLTRVGNEAETFCVRRGEPYIKDAQRVLGFEETSPDMGYTLIVALLARGMAGRDHTLTSNIEFFPSGKRE